MANKDTGFKVTDRRKFHSDGTPRDADEPNPAQAAAEPESADEAPAQSADNVVSFPGEAKKQSEPSPSSQSGGEGASADPPDDSSTASNAAAQVEQAYNQARESEPSGLPEASFLAFVNMLGVEAAMHLGLIETPGQEPQPPDLEAARHLIDALGMLQTKTRGNLTADEDTLLDNILADLRMQFVAISRGR